MINSGDQMINKLFRELKSEIKNEEIFLLFIYVAIAQARIIEKY